MIARVVIEFDRAGLAPACSVPSLHARGWKSLPQCSTCRPRALITMAPAIRGVGTHTHCLKPLSAGSVHHRPRSRGRGQCDASSSLWVAALCPEHSCGLKELKFETSCKTQYVSVQVQPLTLAIERFHYPNLNIVPSGTRTAAVRRTRI